MFRYVSMYVCIYVYMYICIYVYMYICICVHVYMYICIYVYIYMYICIYVYMYICIYVYIYVYMYIGIYVYMPWVCRALLILTRKVRKKQTINKSIAKPSRKQKKPKKQRSEQLWGYYGALAWASLFSSSRRICIFTQIYQFSTIVRKKLTQARAP